MKTCSMCKQTKPESEYHRRAKSADGLQGRCKSCAHEAYLQRYSDRAKRERMLRANRDWHTENRDAVRARHEQYRRDAGVPLAKRLDPHAEAKVCLTCGQSKPLDEFGVSGAVADGRAAHCTECARANRRAWYRANREYAIGIIQAYQRRHPDRVRRSARAVSARYRARRATAVVTGIQVTARDIAARWQMWDDKCYVCGAPASETDHVIPLARGGLHVPANLRPICRSCNARKNASDWRAALAGCALADERTS